MKIQLTRWRQALAVTDSDATVASSTINGPAIELPAGSYTVRIATQENALNAVVHADETTVLTLTGE